MPRHFRGYTSSANPDNYCRRIPDCGAQARAEPPWLVLAARCGPVLVILIRAARGRARWHAPRDTVAEPRKNSGASRDVARADTFDVEGLRGRVSTAFARPGDRPPPSSAPARRARPARRSSATLAPRAVDNLATRDVEALRARVSTAFARLGGRAPPASAPARRSRHARRGGATLASRDVVNLATAVRAQIAVRRGGGRARRRGSAGDGPPGAAPRRATKWPPSPPARAERAARFGSTGGKECEPTGAPQARREASAVQGTGFSLDELPCCNAAFNFGSPPGGKVCEPTGAPPARREASPVQGIGCRALCFGLPTPAALRPWLCQLFITILNLGRWSGPLSLSS